MTAGMPVVLEQFCRRCGWDEEIFWEDGRPTGAICDCCGSESGIGDMGARPGTWDGVKGLHDVRGWWIGHGARWTSPGSRPPDWDLLRQLRNIPEPWRTPPPPADDRERRAAGRAASASLGTETACRICGLSGPVFWRDGEPTGTVCPCCGGESGLDDLGHPGARETMRTIRARRGHWAGLGAPWADPAARPADWDVLVQLGALPPVWR